MNITSLILRRRYPVTLDDLGKADREGYWGRPHEVRLDLRTEGVV